MSSNRLKRKELFVQLFGSDSDDDLSYITPSKVQQLIQVWPVISPIGKTPEHVKRALSLFPTRQHTRSESEKDDVVLDTTVDADLSVARPLFATSPYSTHIQSPMHSLTQDNTAAHAQLLVVVHNNERYAEYLQQQLRAKAEGCTPLKYIKSEHVPRLLAVQPDCRTQADIVSLVAARTKANEEEHAKTHTRAYKHRFVPYNASDRLTNDVGKKIVDSLSQKEVDCTRIINLRNKNVPQGVHLAIAVDSSKFYSKNALKKITRNLSKQL